MSQEDPSVEEIRKLLGTLPEIPVPEALDRSVLAGAHATLAGALAKSTPASPPSLAWVASLVGLVILVAAGFQRVQWPSWPHDPSCLFYVALGFYLLALLVSPLILIRTRYGGIHHE